MQNLVLDVKQVLFQPSCDVIWKAGRQSCVLALHAIELLEPTLHRGRKETPKELITDDLDSGCHCTPTGQTNAECDKPEAAKNLDALKDH